MSGFVWTHVGVRLDLRRGTHDPRPICIQCEIARKRYRSMADMRRELREACQTTRAA